MCAKRATSFFGQMSVKRCGKIPAQQQPNARIFTWILKGYRFLDALGRGSAAIAFRPVTVTGSRR